MEIRVHYPETKEGWEQLEDVVATVQAEILVNWIMRQNCSAAEKKRLIHRAAYGPDKDK